ncbi:MAG TPA: hypothetical protein VGJ70_09115, partial [Solirubrobacteraceae bacterium]
MRQLTTLAALCAAALVAATPAAAGPRMYVGFLDDVSFRWGLHRAQSFDHASRARASVLRTIVRWRDIAHVRPARPSDSWDPAYRFDDLDEFVRRA